MSAPTIADNKPVKLALDKDKKYYFCMCGLSNKQPFCDGSTRAVISPRWPFNVTKAKIIACASASTAATNPTVTAATNSSVTIRLVKARISRVD